VNSYFLTGGTGAVGSRILEQLLEDAGNRIYVLVRADSDAAAAERVHRLLPATVGGTDTDRLDRVIALRGDTRQPMFGMARERYEMLTGECQRIIHSAGLVRMNLPLAEARESAVVAADNVLALASSIARIGRLEKVEFVSTVGVGGRTAEVPERWMESPRGFHNTYEQAKAEAEIRVRNGVSEGLPITVHRPSMVVGDTIDGRISSFQVFYHLCEFLSGQRSRGLFPAFGNTRLDTIPVDHVARVIVWSSARPETSGKILHLCSGPHHAIAIADLQRLVITRFRDHGIRTAGPWVIPRALFRAMLVPLGALAPEKIRSAIRTAPIFLDYLASEQAFVNEVTDKLLAPVGMAVPPTTSYLPKALDYYLSRKKPRTG